ncbi:hypothetical protein LTR29_002881, partial [Friedmanniomyces endolithicus]
MAAPSPTTTFKRRAPCTWSYAYVAAPRRGKRRCTLPRRRSSTSARRPSLRCSSTTRWMGMARLSVSGESARQRPAVPESSWLPCTTASIAAAATSLTSSMRRN